MTDSPATSPLTEKLNLDTSEYQHSAGILVIDEGGVILACNEVFMEMSGYGREEIVGQESSGLLHLHAPQKGQPLLATAEQSPEFRGTVSLQDKQGNFFSYSSNSYTHSAGSNGRQTIISLYDISREGRLRRSLTATQIALEKTIADNERKLHEYTASLIETNVDLRKKIREHSLAAEALKASETRFRDLTETTSDFIWEIDRNACYTYASPKISKLLGYSPEELLGRKFLLLAVPEMAARFSREIAGGGNPERGFSSWHYSHTHRDGREVVIESSGEPIILKKNQISGYRGIDRDITDRVHYEKNIRIAKELAESANRAKSEFLANMSHELRTPLHAILSFAKFGEKRTTAAESAELHKYFQQIETSGQRLLPLINSLLDLSKLEAGKMNYEIVYGGILDEVQTAVDEVYPLTAQKDVQIIIDRRHAETTVYADKNKIAQVIRNILSNAVKFCNEHSTISISFAQVAGKNAKMYLRVTVANSGIVIPDNELETIFDKFAQSSKTRTGAGGTGLGLAICRQILLDLRGRIWAETTDDNLTQFHFTLPTYPKGEKIGQILIDKGLVSKDDLETALFEQE